MATENNNAIPDLSPEEMQEINKRVDEIVNSYYRIEGEREHIKEIKKSVQEEYKLPAKKLKQLADIRFKGNGEELQEETEEIIMYEQQLRQSKQNQS